MLFMSCFASGDDFSNSPFRPHREDEAPLMHMLHALLVSNRNFFCPNWNALLLLWLVAWHSGRTSVSGRRTFPVLRSTCS